MLPRKYIFLIAAIGGILVLSLAGLFLSAGKKTSTATIQNIKTATPPSSTSNYYYANANSPRPTNIREVTKYPFMPTKAMSTGLNLHRDTLIDQLQKLGPDTIQFSAQEQINGADNYVSQDGQNIIQLLGPANNLNTISTVADMRPPASADEYIIKVANVVDPQSTAWVTRAVQDISKPLQTTGLTRAASFNGKSYQLVGQPDFTAITLTIEPANEY